MRYSGGRVFSYSVKCHEDGDNSYLSGYAWGENIGWIHFRNDSPLYGVVRMLLEGVPALNEWGVSALVLALAGLACLRLKRIRAAA